MPRDEPLRSVINDVDAESFRLAVTDTNVECPALWQLSLSRPQSCRLVGIPPIVIGTEKTPLSRTEILLSYGCPRQEARELGGGHLDLHLNQIVDAALP